MSTEKFLGTGWAFPISVTPSGGIALSRDEQKIRESINILLGTAKGERVMRPDFGCDLRTLVFEPNNSVTASLARHHVEQALTMWEPRVEIENVDVKNDIENSCLHIQIEYRVRATNSPHNLVYPFYLNE